MTSHIYSINQLHEMTGVDRRTIKKRLGSLQPVQRDGKTSFYDSQAALPLIFIKDSRKGSDAEMAIESFLLERARRLKAEIEVDQLMGKLIPVDMVSKEVEREYTIVRSQLRSLPSKLAIALAITTDPSQVQMVLTEAINDSLNELTADAKYQQQQLSIAAQPPVDSISESGDGVEADPEPDPR